LVFGSVVPPDCSWPFPADSYFRHAEIQEVNPERVRVYLSALPLTEVELIGKLEQQVLHRRAASEFQEVGGGGGGGLCGCGVVGGGWWGGWVVVLVGGFWWGGFGGFWVVGVGLGVVWVLGWGVKNTPFQIGIVSLLDILGFTAFGRTRRCVEY